MTACIWLTPGDVRAAPPVSSRLFAERASAPILVKSLEVWGIPPDEPYDLRAEVDGVARFAAARGLSRFHLFGFSAGATVALATALRLGPAVRTLAVLEPATIGDDDWHPVESAWRRDLAELRLLPPPERDAAFRRLVLRPDVEVPPPLTDGDWTGRADALEDMLAATGLRSDDLAAIGVPTLVLTGGRSNPRFALLAAHLLTLLPSAGSALFEARSHLDPPHRTEPARLHTLLTRLWS